MSKEKAIIFFTVTIDVVSLGIIIPVLPLYVESFGLTAFSVTLLLSVFSLFSFLSAPFLGALSDKIGRRPVLLLSIASTSLGWFIFALGRSLPVLMLARIVDGMAAGNISTAQSSISDISKDSKDRASNLGFIGMIFGLGFIIGPFIGGVLSKVSPAFPFWFVGGLALVNVILAYFFLPETNKHLVPDKKISWNPARPLISAVKNIKLRLLYLVYFLFNTIAFISNSIFALYLAKTFNFSPFQVGLFFTLVGVVLTINQGFLIRKFWLAKFKEKQLIQMMLVAFVLSFVFVCVPSVWSFVVGVFIGAFAQSTLGVAISSEIVGEADIKERGEAVGVMSGVASVATVIAPLIAGAAFQYLAFLPYLISMVLSFAALFIISRIKLHDRQSPEISELAQEVTA